VIVVGEGPSAFLAILVPLALIDCPVGIGIFPFAMFLVILEIALVEVSRNVADAAFSLNSSFSHISYIGVLLMGDFYLSMGDSSLELPNKKGSVSHH